MNNRQDPAGASSGDGDRPDLLQQFLDAFPRLWHEAGRHVHDGHVLYAQLAGAWRSFATVRAPDGVGQGLPDLGPDAYRAWKRRGSRATVAALGVDAAATVEYASAADHPRGPALLITLARRAAPGEQRRMAWAIDGTDRSLTGEPAPLQAAAAGDGADADDAPLFSPGPAVAPGARLDPRGGTFDEILAGLRARGVHVPPDVEAAARAGLKPADAACAWSLVSLGTDSSTPAPTADAAYQSTASGRVLLVTLGAVPSSAADSQPDGQHVADLRFYDDLRSLLRDGPAGTAQACLAALQDQLPEGSGPLDAHDPCYGVAEAVIQPLFDTLFDLYAGRGTQHHDVGPASPLLCYLDPDAPGRARWRLSDAGPREPVQRDGADERSYLAEWLNWARGVCRAASAPLAAVAYEAAVGEPDGRTSGDHVLVVFESEAVPERRAYACALRGPDAGQWRALRAVPSAGRIFAPPPPPSGTRGGYRETRAKGGPR